MTQRRSRLGRTRAVLAGGIALGGVLIVHGFVPGLLNTAAWDYLLEGDMRCLGNLGAEVLTSWCDAYGRPLGYPFFSSGPNVFLGWALIGATGMSSYSAYVLSAAAFDAVALAGGYGLLRMLGARRAVALVASAAYLISPTVVGMRDFGGTFTGITLLPASALVDLLTIRTFERGGRNRMATAAAAYAIVQTFILFLDGYAFMLSGLVSASLWLWWSLQSTAPLCRRVLGAAAVVGGHLVAAAAYRWYVPSIAGPSPIGVFRSMGLDVTTLLLPSHYVWGANFLGTTWDHTVLWGDGTNAAYNYLGVVCVVLAAVAVTVKSSPGTWCKTAVLISSVKRLVLMRRRVRSPPSLVLFWVGESSRTGSRREPSWNRG